MEKIEKLTPEKIKLLYILTQKIDLEKLRGSVSDLESSVISILSDSFDRQRLKEGVSDIRQNGLSYSYGNYVSDVRMPKAVMHLT